MSLDIFLSYASEDAPKAMELARVLQADGWSVSCDRETPTGQDPAADVNMDASKARAVVVLWSAFSVSSSRVKNEAREAKEANKLIPVLLEDARIPLSYRSLSTIDLRQWPDKKSPLEISQFKSVVSRLLHQRASNSKLKKPAGADDLTLSVRVANFAKNRRISGYGTEADLAAQNPSLALERCITDILLDILHTPPATVALKVDAYVMQLANILRAPFVICSEVNFSRMSVSKIRGMSHGKVTKLQEKAVLEYVNQYCSPLGEHNLHLEPDKWPEGEMLCLPLLQHLDGREFAWFTSEASTGDWTQTTQERLLKLASGIQAGVSRASTQ